MEYVKLGESGLKVSRVCLGTMTFGREADEEMSFKIMDRYRELGGNFIDTAESYAEGGLSEAIIGRWLKDRGVRDETIVATKVHNGTGSGGVNDRGLSRHNVIRTCEASLKRLQTDVIDLYQIHRWDPEVPAEETLEALNDLVRQGKVRYLGCSNHKAWHLCTSLQIMKEKNWSKFISVQPLYNAINRWMESELLPLATAKGLGVITYNPLAGGLLSGKYRKDKPLPKGSRLEELKGYYNRFYTDRSIEIAEGFVNAAEKRGITPAQLALAWVLSEPRITCPIVGARNLEQLNDTVGGLEIELSGEEREDLPAVLPGRWEGKDTVYDNEGYIRLGV